MKHQCKPVTVRRKLIAAAQDISFLVFICGFAVASSPLWGPIAYRRWREAKQPSHIPERQQ